MRRNHKNFNTAGSASCVGLALLAFLLVNPMAELSASAMEGLSVSAESEEAGEVAAQADVLTSEVSFAFGEPVGVTTLTPVSGEGASARYSVKATIGVENSGGYAVYLGGSKSELTGKKTGATINGVNSSTGYEDMPVNSWGYSVAEGEEMSAAFRAVPTNNRGDKIGENVDKVIKADSKTFMLSFAAHIGNDKPADTYENQVTLSVVSSPLEVTGLTSLTEMQEMTSAVCEASTVGDEAQLRDVRDGKYYWVAKLADGKCWMTQNLDLDLSTGKALTAADSDVPEVGYTPTYDTADVVASSTILADNTGQRSWSLGNYRIISPNTSSDCGSAKASAANCTSQFALYDTPTSVNGEENAHYILGNHYQWNAATAGTGGTMAGGQATNSICPKGWRLPTSAGSGEFATLVAALGGVSTTNNITKAPFYGVRGGAVRQGVDLFANAGNNGYYWSSTAHSSNDSSYSFYFYATGNVNSARSNLRRLGFSARCVAR